MSSLSARFMHDPQFKVVVNGHTVPLEDHSGVVQREVLKDESGRKIEVFLIDATKSNKRSRYSGIAFWVGGRLVGVPSWVLGGRMILDGRLRQARQFSVIARCDSLREFVRPDWSGFVDSDELKPAFDAVGKFIESAMKKDALLHAEEATVDALKSVRSDLERLPAVARIEVAEFAQRVVAQNPTMPQEYVSTAVRAAVQLETARSGQSLLEKLSRLPEGDIDALDRLLSEWTVRDALTVLDEIDSRLSVVMAIDRLASDPGVDELHTLHPLVVKARWVFGPQYDSPEYVSNRSVRRALEQVLGIPSAPDDFINPVKRPDVIVKADGSIYGAGVSSFEGETTRLSNLLVIELKRGGYKIGRNEVNQATGYVEDLLQSGHLDGVPAIQAYVVGHEVDARIERTRRVGDRGRIEVLTFSTVVHTAHRRLFRLKEQLPRRYEELSGQALLLKALGDSVQQPSLPDTGLNGR